MRCERCGISCLDAEDYRDHLPCPGSLKERQAARISELEAERDRLKNELKAEKVKHYTLALEWLCEPENFQLMEAVYPDTIRRLAATISGEGK